MNGVVRSRRSFLFGALAAPVALTAACARASDTPRSATVAINAWTPREPTREQWYFKRRLVPFGEYFPVPAFVRNWMRLMSLPNSDFAAGSDTQAPLAVAGQTLAPTICYEDAYGVEQLALVRKSSLLVNVSNDAWFGDSLAAEQHFQLAQMRALESGRMMLRANNTGVTAIIGVDGTTLGRLPGFVNATLSGVAQGRTGATPYVRIGDWGIAGIVVSILLAILVFGRPRRDSAIQYSTITKEPT